MGGNSLSAGVGWPQLLWGANQGGLVDNNAGPPMMNFAGNTPYTNIGQQWQQVRLREERPLAVLERPDVGEGTAHGEGWVRVPPSHVPVPRVGDRHRRRVQLRSPRHGGLRRRGNNLSQTGDPFASFLLGQVQQASQTIPVYPTFNEAYTAAWINDEFKVSNNLTVTLGLRFDYQFARTERDDQYSTFDPNTPNPGAGNIPGALIFAGTGPGRTGTAEVRGRPTRTPGARGRVLPTELGEKNVIRGGYGVYYAGVAFGQGGLPTVGFQANLLAPNLSNGVSPAFYLDNGFPQDRVTFPPFINPAFANGTAPLAVTPNGLTLPRFQNWSVTYQRQLTDNMMLGISYIGNRGSRLSHNASTLGVDANMNDPERAGARCQPCCSRTSTRRRPRLPESGPHIPVSQGMWRRRCENIRSTRTSIGAACRLGESQYHAVETVLERRFSRGLQARVAYTFSKLHNNSAENAQGSDGANARFRIPRTRSSGPSVRTIRRMCS